MNIILRNEKTIDMKKKIIIIFISIFSGIVTGFFGAGGGLVLVPFLSLYLKINEKVTRATTIFIILFYSIVASIIYFNVENINYILVIQCTFGGIIGSFFGSKLLKKVNNLFLNIIFIVLLVYSGIKFIR